MYTFYEFFAGGGMARLGLGYGWQCLYANDISVKKTAVYRANFQDAAQVLQTRDIGKVVPSDLLSRADLAWASFPCQDLSLAGPGAGLEGKRSGVFWKFWKLLCELENERRNPKVVVLENVQGALTSHGGADFVAIVEALTMAGYAVGGLTVDAAYFIPQSRPRLFFVAVRNDVAIPRDLLHGQDGPRGVENRIWHSDRLIAAQAVLPEHLKQAWVWWRMDSPGIQRVKIDHFLQPDEAVAWHTPETTSRLLEMMSEMNRRKVSHAMQTNTEIVGTVYRRTRLGVQRAEVRFDGISGCLRTPEGGSSRQTVLKVHGTSVRSRLLTSREAARLMGLPDTYKLPLNYNDAYHIAGDGLVVPAVSWIERQLLRPLLDSTYNPSFPAATVQSELLYA